MLPIASVQRPDQGALVQSAACAGQAVVGAAWRQNTPARSHRAGARQIKALTGISITSRADVLPEQPEESLS